MGDRAPPDEPEPQKELRFVIQKTDGCVGREKKGETRMLSETPFYGLPAQVLRRRDAPERVLAVRLLAVVSTSFREGRAFGVGEVGRGDVVGRPLWRGGNQLRATEEEGEGKGTNLLLGVVDEDLPRGDGPVVHEAATVDEGFRVEPLYELAEDFCGQVGERDVSTLSRFPSTSQRKEKEKDARSDLRVP